MGLWLTLILVDDPDEAGIQKDKDTTKDFGLIQVSFEQVIFHNKNKLVAKSLVSSNGLEVAEKALKGRAISHYALYVPIRTLLLNAPA